MDHLRLEHFTGEQLLSFPVQLLLFQLHFFPLYIPGELFLRVLVIMRASSATFLSCA